MEGLTEGRIVHFVLEDGQHRPGIVVKVWRIQVEMAGETGVKSIAPQNGCCNLQVFADGFNDQMPNVSWQTSIIYSEDPKPGTWHWIEKA